MPSLSIVIPAQAASSSIVIPAQAGIHARVDRQARCPKARSILNHRRMDPRLRGDDGGRT